MGLADIHVITTLTSCGPCAVCGMEFAAPHNLVTKWRQGGEGFYCPAGHSLLFKDPENARLKKQLEQERTARMRAEELRNASLQECENARLQERLTRGKLRALKTRVRNGVCPCCKRSFVQLQRHMETKHPDFNQAPEPA